MIFKYILMIILIGYLLIAKTEGIKCLESIKNKLVSFFNSEVEIACPDNDDDLKSIFYDFWVVKKYSTIVIVFDENSYKPNEKVFDFVKENAKPWFQCVQFIRVFKNKCPKTVSDYNIETMPIFVIIEEKKEVLPRIFGDNFAHDMNERIISWSTVLYAKDDKDFDEKLKYIDNDYTNTLVAMVFGSESNRRDQNVFEFIQKNACPWHTSVKFFKIDTDKCPEIGAKYGIEKTPTFIFRENKRQDNYRIVGTNYKEDLMNYIDKSSRVLTAIDDTDFNKLLIQANTWYNTVGLVFCHGLDKDCQKYFKIIQKNSKNINSVKFLNVDLDKCSNSVHQKYFRTYTRPIIVFTYNEKEITSMDITDLENQLSNIPKINFKILNDSLNVKVVHL